MAEEYFRRPTEFIKRIKVIVEGQTEETFIKEVLNPHFAQMRIFLFPILLGKPGLKGGIRKYEKAQKDIILALKQDKNAFCTTMFDFFGLPKDFPGMPLQANLDFIGKAKIIEKALSEDIANILGPAFDKQRFIPYIQMYDV